jgi:hypothetical protein
MVLHDQTSAPLRCRLAENGDDNDRTTDTAIIGDCKAAFRIVAPS